MLFIIAALFLSATPLNPSPETDTKNHEFVLWATGVCVESKCRVCGLFSYDQFGKLQYDFSLCEWEFREKQRIEELRKLDQEVRKRYGK